MSASGGSRGLGGDARAIALACLPILFALPVLYAIGSSIEILTRFEYPFLADVSGTSADARAVALGAPLYQDPGAGYTPLTYTPLYNVLGGALNLAHDWDGWPLLLTLLADLALIGIGARLAYRAPGSSLPLRLAVAAGAVGMGALAFWLAGFVPFNSFLAPRPDQLAWAFTLGGLVLIPAAARGSRRAGVGAVVLLTLGWWTKQPVVVGALAATIWLTLAAMRGWTTWRIWAALVGGLAVVGATSFGLAHLLTDGWSTTFVLDYPRDRARPAELAQTVKELLRSTGPAAVAAGAFWLAVVLSRGRRAPGPQQQRRGPEIPADALRIGSLLLLFALLEVPASLYLRDAVGVVQNQFLGLAWALALLAALAWGLAQRARASALAAAMIVLALFAVSESNIAPRWLSDHLGLLTPRKSQRVIIFPQPPALLELAQDRSVYHPAYPGLGAEHEEDLYPGQDNVASLTWSGQQPGYLVQALLDRRFDLVYPMAPSYGTGRWEDNYVWKLNQVMRAKYRPDPALPPDLVYARIAPYPFAPFIAGRPLVRRPGPDPAPWMARCFGPFEIAGVSWRIAGGGGLWCRPKRQAEELVLVRTPAPSSEIRADDYVADQAGRIVVHAGRTGRVEVEVGGETIRKAVNAGKPTVFPVPAGARGISLRAGARSRVRVDLGQLGS